MKLAYLRSRPLPAPVRPRTRPQRHKGRRVLAGKPDPALGPDIAAQRLDVLVALLEPHLEVAVGAVPRVGVVLPLGGYEGEGFAVGRGGRVPVQAGVERVQKPLKKGVVFGRGGVEIRDLGDDVGCAGAVGVEEEGGVGAVAGEAGE